MSMPVKAASINCPLLLLCSDSNYHTILIIFLGIYIHIFSINVYYKHKKWDKG